MWYTKQQITWKWLGMQNLRSYLKPTKPEPAFLPRPTGDPQAHISKSISLCNASSSPKRIFLDWKKVLKYNMIIMAIQHSLNYYLTTENSHT